MPSKLVKMGATASSCRRPTTFLGNLAQQWGMEVEDVRGILFEGLDPNEVRSRIIRERRDRRIGEVTRGEG